MNCEEKSINEIECIVANSQASPEELLVAVLTERLVAVSVEELVGKLEEKLVILFHPVR